MDISFGIKAFERLALLQVRYHDELRLSWTHETFHLVRARQSLNQESDDILLATIPGS